VTPPEDSPIILRRARPAPRRGRRDGWPRSPTTRASSELPGSGVEGLFGARAELEAKLGEHEVAVADFTRELARSQEDAALHLGRAASLEALGRHPEAIARPRRRAPRGCPPARVRLARGRARLALGLLEPAREDFAAVIATPADDLEAPRRSPATSPTASPTARRSRCAPPSSRTFGRWSRARPAHVKLAEVVFSASETVEVLSFSLEIRAVEREAEEVGQASLELARVLCRHARGLDRASARREIDEALEHLTRAAAAGLLREAGRSTTTPTSRSSTTSPATGGSCHGSGGSPSPQRSSLG